ncbi:shikimate kinase [Bacillus litorisediminis]|uniref:shikimate kinase n=1 Tax=Bacillus litorisediminis TaxID=2922713 RepID=UPI001FAD2D43|nr:shikimate kinase [Bacillus litorisediminis]
MIGQTIFGIVIKKGRGIMKAEPIYLTGFMGSGKTTLSHLLGQQLGLPVLDTDQLIEQQEQMQIKDIFASKGEEYFRELETKVLQSIREHAVVSTGGGIVTKEENREWMLKNGIVVFLDCEIEQLWSRIKEDSTRPLAKSKEEVTKLYFERKPFYLQCHIQMNTTDLSIHQSLMLLLHELKSF